METKLGLSYPHQTLHVQQLRSVWSSIMISAGNGTRRASQPASQLAGVEDQMFPRDWYLLQLAGGNVSWKPLDFNTTSRKLIISIDFLATTTTIPTIPTIPTTVVAVAFKFYFSFPLTMFDVHRSLTRDVY